MKSEEVTCIAPITGGKYGSREKDEKFTVDTRDAVEFEKLGLVSRQKASSGSSAQ